MSGACRAPQPVDDSVRRSRTALRWAAGVLGCATVALVGYLSVLIAFVWMMGAAVDILRPSERTELDLASFATDVLPGLTLAWCSGLAATAVLSRAEALGPRAAGILSGLLGVGAGALVLNATDLL